MSLPITNVLRVAILTALRGLGSVNTSMIGLLTDEVPIPNDFGTYRAYKEPNGIAADFGSNSETYRLGLMVFNQQPNILLGNGSLLIVPRDPAAPDSAATLISSFLVDFTQLDATDYNINLDVDGVGAADELIGSIDTTSLATIAASLNSTAMQAAGATFSVSGEITKCRVTLVSDTAGAASDLTTAAAGTGTDIAPLLGISLATAVGTATGTESIKDTIIRTINDVPYFGLIYNEKMTDAILTEVSAVVQAYNIVQFVGSSLSADLAAIFNTTADSGYTKTRCLYYSNSENDALDFAAGYASRGLSVNFSGFRTMITMNLKEITGLVPDPIFSTSSGQTRYDECKANGVDCYADYGVPGVASFGFNSYFDEIYIQLAYKLDLEVAGFNFLKQNPTKTPQTEEGVAGLKTAYREVAKKYVRNGSFAPGAWSDPVYFGNPADQIRNIAEFGYWFYSIPVADQPTVDRTDRLAPVIQNANKLSGAIHGSDITVYLER